MIKAVEEIAIENKIKLIECASSVSAVTFYEKMGHRKNGLDKKEAAGRQIGMEKKLSL